MPLSTRTVLLYMLSGATIFLPATGQPVDIEVGCFSTDYGAKWLEREIRSFRAAHPHVNVHEYAVLEPTRYRNPIECWERLARNVIGIDAESGNEVQFLVDQDLLVPIDDFLPDPALTLSDFYESAWKPVQYQGKTWAVPWNYWSVLLLINWKLFQEEGLAEAPKTWAELEAAAKRLTKDRDGDGTIDQYGLRVSMRHEGLPYAVLSKVFQDGGHIMEDGRFDITHDVFISTFNYFGKLIRDESMAKVDSRELAEVLKDDTQTFAMEFLPTFDLAVVQHDSDYGVVPIPTDARRAILAENRQYFAVMRATPEEEAASWEFVKWMTRPDVSLGPDWSVFPCRKSIASRPELQTSWNRGVQGIPTALSEMQYAVDLESPAFNRRGALYYLIKRLATPMYNGEDMAAHVEIAETKANALLAVPPIAEMCLDAVTP